MNRSASPFPVLLGLILPALGLAAPPEPTRDEVVSAMKKASTYFREKVASRGGYLYYYSADLSRRWGEGEFTAETIFVQPPGTPAVGMAYLRAYEATGERFFLDAARETAEALVAGQLESGGWTQAIHFGPHPRRGKYRAGGGGSWNASSLDDGQTQAALALLFRFDRALEFKDAKIHEAAQFGLKALIAAQFENGAFPQVWTKRAEPHGAVQAKYPDYDWKTAGRVKNYWDYYTLNDGLAGTVAETLVLAHEVYKDDASRAALLKLGDFLLAAQMPDPQPGWCQQYSYEMTPIWARKFEPPAITGYESQDAMRTLIRIARETGEKKYLEPIPRAIAYFRKSLLADGRVARFYELRTNKPLYMDAKYQLTYDDSETPSHYGWKQSAKFDEIEREYRSVLAGEKKGESRQAKNVSPAAVRKILADLDAEGRWVSTYAGEKLVGQSKFPPGFRYIASEVFIENLDRLSASVAAK